MNELRQEVGKLPNAVLVGSNQIQDDVRSQTKVVKSTAVLEGSYELVMAYHTAAQTNPVLETRLDADDALSVHFVEYLQTRASQMLLRARKESTNWSSWIVLCAFESLEWQLYSPWDTESRVGAVSPAKQNFCLTPGLTAVYDISATRSDIPTDRHDKFSRLISPCGRHRLKNCLEKIALTHRTTSLRARTPTSAGMEHVLTSDGDETHDLQRKTDSLHHTRFHQEAWRDLTNMFGIDRKAIVQARSKLLENLPDIVDEALQGQCTKGHSCKKSAKKKLQVFQAMGKKKVGVNEISSNP